MINQYIQQTDYLMPYNFDVFPVLHTARLELVAIEPSHIQAMYMLLTDERVTEYFPVISIAGVEDIVPVIENFNTQYRQRKGIRWGIVLKETREFIGTIGFQHFIQGSKTGVVYALHPDHWGRGYASEALQEMMRFGFEELEVRRIEAEVIPGNAGSERVLEKNGFNYEGLFPQSFAWNGKCFDVNRYAAVF